VQSERPHRQEDVEDVIVDVLSHGRILTTQEITRAVKVRLPLSAADLRKANKRDNESKIDQIIANALQERRRLCRKGLIERVTVGEFRLTEKGRKYLREREEMMNDAMTLLNQLLPDTE